MSDWKKNGGPAFPIGSGDVRDPFGMTLRDYFATAELAKKDDVATLDEAENYARLARHCYRIADAMLEARDTDAPQPQAEPVGEWVMVPREPTEAMLGAGRAKARNGYTLEAAWEAMLAAAPKRGGA